MTDIRHAKPRPSATELWGPAVRSQEFAARAVTLWKGQEKLQKELAEFAGMKALSLTHALSGTIQLGSDTAARIVFHLYDSHCFTDATEAIDLAWLMGLTAGTLEDLILRNFQKDYRIDGFLQWLQSAGSNRASDEMLDSYLPSLPAFHVPTKLARQIKQDIVSPRDYRVPLHQVIVLHGGSAVGKTTAAAFILRDESLCDFFRDGVLFVPLERAEDQKKALARACEQAGLDGSPEEPGPELQRSFERWARQEKRLALLVLDDPQSAEVLAPFLNVGPQVRVLITCQDRHTVARALEERWGPSSDLIRWQPVTGLSENEGLELLERWQPGPLSSDEEQARQHVGKLLGWHPVALRLYAAEASDITWRKVETLVLEGNHAPDDFSEMVTWFSKSWARLSIADRQALISLRRTFSPASTFGIGIAAAVWESTPAQAQVRIRRLEARALVEQVTDEPWPWQESIRRAYGGEERYRMMPLLRLLDVEALGIRADQAQVDASDRTSPKAPRRADPDADEIKRLQGIERRAKTLPIGPGQIPWQFRLANLLVLPAAWLVSRESRRLEERLMRLWDRQGLQPPAEVWLAFQKSRWGHISFGYAVGVLLLLFGAWYVRSAIVEGEGWLFLASLLSWACAFFAVYLFIRQRSWWLWLLGLHGQETTELRWTWWLAGLFGLRRQRLKDV